VNIDELAAKITDSLVIEGIANKREKDLCVAVVRNAIYVECDCDHQPRGQRGEVVVEWKHD
jgi:hypothetical protein